MAIEKGYKTNFETLQKAFANGDVALVETKRAGTGEKVVLLCAMRANEDETITPVPLAEMVSGNPYELYEDPTQ